MQPNDTDQTFSADLEQWLGSDRTKTLGDLGEVFEEKSFAVTILFLMFVPSLPLPTGGITLLFEAAAIVLAAEMVLGLRSIWLPDRWKRRELGPLTTDQAIPFMVRRIRWFERFSRPRFAQLLERRWVLRVIGLLLIAAAAGSAMAPPFSGLDTLPALGAVVIALGVILDDLLVVAIGIAIAAVGIALILSVGAAAVTIWRSLT